MILGLCPVPCVLPMAFTASCAFLLPLDAVPPAARDAVPPAARDAVPPAARDAVPLLTYSKGYCRMFDMLLPGAIISVVWVVVMTLLTVLIAPLAGLC